MAKLGDWRGYRELTSIQYCVVFLRDSLLLLLAAMADSWRQELLDAQVPGPVVEEIVQLYGRCATVEESAQVPRRCSNFHFSVPIPWRNLQKLCWSRRS